MRYMAGLNEWLERDVHDRHAELRGVGDRIDSLRNELAQRLGIRPAGAYECSRIPKLGSDEMNSSIRTSPGRRPHIPPTSAGVVWRPTYGTWCSRRTASVSAPRSVCPTASRILR